MTPKTSKTSKTSITSIMPMIRRLFRLSVFGFIMGMAIGNLIAIISSTLIGGQTLVFSDSLLAKAGSPAAALTIQTLLSGLLGAVAMGGVIFYDIDRLPMLWTCIIHYTTIIAAYLPIALSLGWLEPAAKPVLIMLLLQAAAYAIIWVIMYVRYRVKVRELNEMLAEMET